MKRIMILSLAAMLGIGASATKKEKTSNLHFDSAQGVAASLTMPDGKVVKYTAYTQLYFVTNIEDSTYQYMNIFIPDGATQQTPIFLRTYVVVP